MKEPEESVALPSPPPLAAAFTMEPNSYGVYCTYPGGTPSYTPDELHTLNHISDSVTFTHDMTTDQVQPWWSSFGSSISKLESEYFVPFLNASIFHLMKWFCSGSNSKSLGELDHLINDVILANDFKHEEFIGFHGTRESEQLDNLASDLCSCFSADDSWVETSVNIFLLAEGIKHMSEAAAPQFEVHGLYYCQFIKILKAALQETAAEQYHLSPSRNFGCPLLMHNLSIFSVNFIHLMLF